MHPPQKPSSAYVGPLDVLLGTPLRVRILRALDEAGNVRRASDLARLTSADPTAVQRTVSPLVASGIVERIGAARGAVYRLRAGHPFAPVLRTMFAVERDRRQAIPRAVSEWAEQAAPARSSSLSIWTTLFVMRYGSSPTGWRCRPTLP
jgi:DNA-binding transcriptional ArsR family regulator